MLHTLSALPAAGPAGHVMAGKGGVEAALPALFGKALAAQLQAGETAVPAAAPGRREALALLAGESAAQGPGEAGMPVDPAAGALAAMAQGADPSALVAVVTLPGTPPADVMSMPAIPGQPMASEVLPEAGMGPTDLTGSGQAAPLAGEVPAAQRNPLVLARQKNLPVTPAGIAANPHAFEARSQGELPGGILVQGGMAETIELRPAQAAGLAGLNMPGLAGEGGVGEPARPVPMAAPGYAGLAAQVGSESLAGPRQAAQIATPFGQAQWPSELGDKVVWLAGQRGQVAELSLTPPSLGGIEVRLNLSGHEAGAQFFSANPAVREAIEAALPRLREMMAEAGLSLGQATVSSEPFRQQQPASQQARTGREGDEQGGVMVLASAAGGRASPAGLVDLYV